MKIIEYGSIMNRKKRIKCSQCHTVFELSERDHECHATDQIGIIHDNLPAYYVFCPTCINKVYFDFDEE